MTDRLTVVHHDAMLEHAPDGYDPERPEWTEIIKARLGEHDEGGMQYTHPERPERLRAILRSLEEHPLEGLRWVEPAPADRAAKLRVHGAAHVDYVESYRGRSGWLAADTTAVSPGSVRAADLAAGAAIEAVRGIVQDDGPRRAFALSRPPGHHASTEPEGFCLYNNVAIAAAYAQEALGIERILVVDWDAHHGNGTQALLRERPGILHFDVHADAPVYPGTGPLFDTGRGEAARLINVPLPAESGDAAFVGAFDEILLPAAQRWLPDLVIVSAGFDAHPADLLMNVSAAGFAALTERVQRVADRYAEGRLALVLEGGYRDALSESVRACMSVLTGARDAEPVPMDADDPGHRALLIANRYHSRPVWR